MNRRHFLWAVGGLPGLLHLSCGKSQEVIDATEPFGDDTLAAYTHPPLDLSDEFDSGTLGTQWYPVGVNTPPPSIWSVSYNERGGPDFVDVAFADGRVQLTGSNDRSGGLSLYGTYGGSKRLASPWAMEALLELPAVDYEKTPVRAGITVRVSNESGWAAYAEVGRLAGPGGDKSFLYHEGSYQEGWTGKDEVETARRVYLRIESNDTERRVIRVGMKVNEADEWTWSPALRFSQAVLWLDNLQLMCFDVRHQGLTTKLKDPTQLYSELLDEERLTGKLKPSGEQVRIGFDYARFEGKVLSLAEGIEYVRAEIPKVEMGFPEGERYEAVVPDTLDIEERARYAIHSLTLLTDPNFDYEVYWWTDLTRSPAIIHHDWNDNFGAKYMEGVAMLRYLTGSKENLHVEQRWREVVLRMQAPDGITYIPAVGRPWNYDTVWEGVANREEYLMVPHVCGLLLTAITAFAVRDGGSIWHEAGDKLVEGLSHKMVDKGSYAYFPLRVVGVDSPPVTGREPLPPKGTQFVFAQSFVVQALAQYYRLTGSEAARDLGRKLLMFIKDYGEVFGPDGEWIGFKHFANHGLALLGFTDYALTAKDEELTEFCIKAYEDGKTRTVESVGFMPEFYKDPKYPTTEICEVAQMINVACKLSQAGVADYWEDADRWIRNYFAEGQCLRTDWMNKYLEQEIKETTHSNFHEPSDGAIERSLGAFGGWMTGNDFWEGRMGPFMHCCTATAGPALYVIWNSILRQQGDSVRVNLLLNRTSPSLDLHSYIPYEGKVELKMKQTKSVSLRVPAWADKQEVKCQVGGQTREFQWDGQYIDLGKVKRGQTATVEFPISVREVRTVLGDKEFQLWIKGNTVVDVEPTGKIFPIFERNHYRGPVRYRKVSRFAAQETIDW